MESLLEEYLEAESRKLITRYHKRIQTDRTRRRHFKERTGKPFSSSPRIPRPEYWDSHRQFDPFYVRSNQAFYARSVASSLNNGSYSPLPAIRTKIPKNSGDEFRSIEIFSVVDRAVSNYYFDRLYERNGDQFHSCSYGYRPDRHAGEAIEYLKRNLQPGDDYYVLSCDFKNFFESIGHTYVENILLERFDITTEEMNVVESFLQFEYVNHSGGSDLEKSNINKRGVPQGTSLSLFLANAACDELDHQLDSTGVVFARYGDDVLMVGQRRSQLERCREHFETFEQKGGPAINVKKSTNICYWTSGTTQQGSMIKSVSFLGHKLLIPDKETCENQSNVRIRNRSFRDIKKRISRIIYQNLLHHPLNYDSAVDSNLCEVDRDLLYCIAELRDYLYGTSLSEETVRNGLNDSNGSNPPMQSVLSFYTAVNDDSVFRELDEHIVETLYLANRKRIHLISAETEKYTRRNFREASWIRKDTYTEIDIDPRIPSALLGWLYAKRQH